MCGRGLKHQGSRAQSNRQDGNTERWRRSCEHSARQSLKYKKKHRHLCLIQRPVGNYCDPLKHKALLLFVSNYTCFDFSHCSPSPSQHPHPFLFFCRPSTATLVSPVCVCVRSFCFPLTSCHNHTDCLCQRLTFPNLCALTHTHTLVSFFSAVLALVPCFLSLFSLQPLFSGPQSAPSEYSSTVLLSSSIFFTLAVSLAIITPVPSPPLITPLEANPKPFWVFFLV